MRWAEAGIHRRETRQRLAAGPGTHKDPRDRFKKKNRPERAWSEGDAAASAQSAFGFRRGLASVARQTCGSATRRSAMEQQTRGAGTRRSAVGAGSHQVLPRATIGPWQTKPTGPRSERKPWIGKPPAGDKRPWSGKPPAGDKRPWSGKPPAGDKRP